MAQKNISESELLSIFAEKGFDLKTLEGRKAARALTNTLCKSKWNSSRLIGETLVVFYTLKGFQSREFRIA